MKNKRFSSKTPTTTGVYEMLDRDGTILTIFVEDVNQYNEAFRIKGQPFTYDLTTTDGCKFRKISEL